MAAHLLSSPPAFLLSVAALLYILRWLSDRKRYDLSRIPSAVSLYAI